MPKRTNLTPLPFNFRNVGDQPPTIANIREAQPLKVQTIAMPYDIMVRANLKGKSHIYEDKQACEGLAQVLREEYPHMKLWEVEVHNAALHFHLYNSLPGASSKHAIACNVMVENCGFLTVEVEAQAFKQEPERILHCQFGDDAVWGRFIDLSEYRGEFGARKAVVYTEAKKEHFGKILKH